jgi:hypothetical protein
MFFKYYLTVTHPSTGGFIPRFRVGKVMPPDITVDPPAGERRGESRVRLDRIDVAEDANVVFKELGVGGIQPGVDVSVAPEETNVVPGTRIPTIFIIGPERVLAVVASTCPAPSSWR